jgi:hypothetical protein
LAQRARAQPDPDRPNDAAGAAAHEGPFRRSDRQYRLDFGLVAATGDVRSVRRGQGGADLRTERWALEFVPHGVRVNTVSPGSILVEGNGWDCYRLAHPDYYADYVCHGFPMGRLGTAEEVADVIVFIASPRAHWVNGRNIPVDGLEQPHAPLDRRPF